MKNSTRINPILRGLGASRLGFERGESRGTLGRVASREVRLQNERERKTETWLGGGGDDDTSGELNEIKHKEPKLRRKKIKTVKLQMVTTHTYAHLYKHTQV